MMRVIYVQLPNFRQFERCKAYFLSDGIMRQAPGSVASIFGTDAFNEKLSQSSVPSADEAP